MISTDLKILIIHVVINNSINVSEHSVEYCFWYISYLVMPCLAYCRKTTKQLSDMTEMYIFQIQIKLGLVPRAEGKQTSISVECCMVHTCTCIHTMPRNVSRLDNFSLMHSKNNDFLSIGVLHVFISNKHFKCNWFFFCRVKELYIF